MRVLLLAAGRGERMRPLSDHTAKPLLEVSGHALIEHHIARLAGAGFSEFVVNLSWHGDQIRTRLGDGSRYGVSIAYSDEGAEALETAGGIVLALPLLGDAPFAVVNSDIWTDYPFERLALRPGKLAHLVLVENPAHNPDGDFQLDTRGEVRLEEKTHTFAGIAAYAPELFAGLEPGKRPLAPLLREAAERGEVSGEFYDGVWEDIGTPERLQELRRRV